MPLLKNRCYLLLSLFFILLPALSPPVKAQPQPPVKILFLGDSLCAGYGVEQSAAFPHRIEQYFQKERMPVKVINASISGSTSASGYRRLRWGLRNHPDILVLELGANDGLRGLNLKELEKNLSKTIHLALKHRIKVLLAGMQLPPNYGLQYTRQFKELFRTVAERHQITLIPFLLEGVAGQAELNTADGIHPNAKGHKIIAKTVLQYLLPLLKNQASKQ